MQKIYKKTHKSKKIAQIHADKIKKRGGRILCLKNSNDGYNLKYMFGSKK